MVQAIAPFFFHFDFEVFFDAFPKKKNKKQLY